jgi:hypothetical protein
MPSFYVFEVCTFKSLVSLVLGVSRGSFAFLVLFGCKHRLSSGFVLCLRPQFNWPGSLSSGTFGLFERIFFALIDMVLIFESWIFILELSIMG